MANKRKLNYRIHNPNPAEATAEYIAQVLVEVHRRKIESRLRAAAPPGAPAKNAGMTRISVIPAFFAVK